MRSFIATALVLMLILAPTVSAAGVKVGEKAPDFDAKGVDGRSYNLKSVDEAKVVVLTFTGNNCPVATAYEKRFKKFAKEYREKGVRFLAINVNDNESLAAMKEHAAERGLSFPYAQDASQKSGKAFGARVTPHCFVLDQKRRVVYMGAFDDNWESIDLVREAYVEDAVKQVLAGKEVETSVTRAKGCAIRYRR